MISLFIFIIAVVAFSIMIYTDYLSEWMPVLVLVIGAPVLIWMVIGTHYVEEYDKQYKNFTISEETITEFEDQIFYDNKEIITKDGNIRVRDIDSYEFSDLNTSYIVEQIYDIDGEFSYELVEFSTERGLWFIWWRYKNQWIVKVIRN